MICPTCRGRQFISQGGADDDEIRHVPCPDCIGGVAYCCDPEPPASYICPGCRAVSYNLNDIQERYCGRCHQWADDDP